MQPAPSCLLIAVFGGQVLKINKRCRVHAKARRVRCRKNELDIYLYPSVYPSPLPLIYLPFRPKELADLADIGPL